MRKTMRPILICSVWWLITKWRRTNASKPTLLNKRRYGTQRHVIISTPLSTRFGLFWVNLVNLSAKKDKRQRFRSLVPSLQHQFRDHVDHPSSSPITFSRKRPALKWRVAPALIHPSQHHIDNEINPEDSASNLSSTTSSVRRKKKAIAEKIENGGNDGKTQVGTFRV